MISLWSGTLIGRPAFNADFTYGTLDPRINFSRTSNATITNSAGVIAYAPHNLLTYSEQFDNSAWTKAQCTITANAIAAPNGTFTAEKLVDGTTSNIHNITQSITSYSPAGKTYTVSYYAKKAELNYVTIGLTDISVGNRYAVAIFNLNTGVFVTSEAFGTGYSVVSTSIVDAGDGWYRCSVTCVAGTTVSFLAAAVGSNKDGIITAGAGGFQSYLGASTGIYIWGAQLEIGSTATTYNSTTVKNLLGYSELFDNAAWTKSNSFVQTNLLIYSEDFSNAAWNKGAATITANSVTAPNGYQTADTITATSAYGNVASFTPVASGSAVNTVSYYAKKATYNKIEIGLANTSAFGNGALVQFDLTTGAYVSSRTFGTGYSVASYSITPVGDGWYRCVAVLNTPVASHASTLGLTVNAVNGSTVYIWGAQLVQGSVAGDYRRTDAAALPVYYPNHNGVVCAEKLVETTAAATTHGLTQAVTTSGSANTISVYAKAGERNWVLVGDSTVASARAWFNLSTGVKGTLGIGATSSTIEAVGNGYYRCSVTLTTTAASNTFYIYSATADGAATYTGDGTSGIYIFGAQLSDSASLDPYVLNAAAAPSAAAYYGPRFDYDPVTLQPKGLLIEEQRQNLLLNATLAGTNLATQNVTVTAVAHTLSFYGTGEIVLSGTASATVTGAGAYPSRKTLTFTPTAGTLTLTVTGTVQFAQLEIGSFATSFIPTAASQVTRTADVATVNGSNFYSWFGTNEASITATFDSPALGNRNVLAIDDNTANNYLQIRTEIADPYFRQKWTGTEQVALDLGTVTAYAVNKASYGFKVNDYAAVINSGTVGTDTSASTIIADRMRIGTSQAGEYLNGHVKSIAYYPLRLNDATLKGLTA